VLNIDDTCPSTLKNQQYVQYIYQVGGAGPGRAAVVEKPQGTSFPFSPRTSPAACPRSLPPMSLHLTKAAPRGLVTLDFNQNGDYYISDAVGWGEGGLSGGEAAESKPPAAGV
jgi:hypothetical protein